MTCVCVCVSEGMEALKAKTEAPETDGGDKRLGSAASHTAGFYLLDSFCLYFFPFFLFFFLKEP